MASERMLLTLDEACEFLRVGKVTLYKLFKRGDLKKTKVLRATRVSKAQLQRYVERNTR